MKISFTIRMLLASTIVLIILLAIGPKKDTSDQKLDHTLRRLAEHAYYNGQVDALRGDVRVVLVKDTAKDSLKYVWSKSPWDDGTEPVFKP